MIPRKASPDPATAPGGGEDPLHLFSTWRPTADWVRVHVRRLRERDIRVEVVRRGDRQRGAVLLKVSCGSLRWRLLHQIIAVDGSTRWVPAHGANTVDATGAQARTHEIVAHDPDVWILELDGADLAAIGLDL